MAPGRGARHGSSGQIGEMCEIAHGFLADPGTRRGANFAIAAQGRRRNGGYASVTRIHA
jgi:hypothetical protein